MKISSLIFSVGIFATGASAFAPTAFQTSTTLQKNTHARSSTVASSSALAWGAATMGVPAGCIDVTDEYAQRDVYTMEQWAQQYGAQKADGVELYSEDGSDYQLITQSGLGAGQTVLCVPIDIAISSEAVANEFGGSLQQAEQFLVNIDQGTQARLPLFKLMMKVLAEYEKGEQSVYYPWLNSLPRQFYNGVAMTDACYDCLPPYAGWLTSNERVNYSHFAAAARQGFVPISQEVLGNDAIMKWAYNVAYTRFHEIWQPNRQKLLIPMADMFNHGAEANVEITVDNMGNTNAAAIYDIPAGSPLTISLGDPSNPTPIFAQYGFLPNDCATVFCKAMHLDPQIQELGYEFRDLLIQTESGEIAPKVWDIFLYKLLLDSDQAASEQFYVACYTNDEGTKKQYHDQYFQYTLDALKQHFYGTLADVENLSAKAQSMDVQTHPRVPVILAHNSLVRDTFVQTCALLESMG